jgi:hypothetical protein
MTDFCRLLCVEITSINIIFMETLVKGGAEDLLLKNN